MTAITNEQVVAACRAGAHVLASDDVRVPATLMGDLILLREILAGVARGQLVIGQPPKTEHGAEAQEAVEPVGKGVRRRKAPSVRK